MIKPEYKELKDFPVSNKTSEGIHYIPADFNNITIRALYNIEYVQREIPLYLNILVPEKQYLEDVQKETYPLLVYIQGSAWRKQNVIEHIIPLSNIARKGFVVAIVQYRDTSIAPFPAQIEDTKTAISFLVEHHQDYQIDTKNIFLGGDSSGGHTAIMTGITANQNILELEKFKYASSIQGIFDYYGPTLVSEMQNEPSIQDHVTPTSPEGLLLGGVNVLEHKQEAYHASPLPYIKKDIHTPSILMIHGNKDRLVPFGQSILLYNALKENNKDVTFYCVDQAVHGGAAFWNDQVLEITSTFLKEHTKK